MAERGLDLTTIGETMLRLSVPEGERLERMRSLDVWPGGAESNVAVAVARMGFRVGWVSRLPRTPLGRRVERAVGGEGVDISRVIWTDEDRVGTYFIEYASSPRRIEVVYDRRDSAAARMQPEQIPWDYLLDTRMLHFTGITAGLSQSCLDVCAAACERARAAKVPVSIDVNYRAKLWSPDVAAAALLPLLQQADLVICGQADAATLWKLQGDPEHVLRRLHDLSAAPTVVLTLGDQGALALDPTGQIHRQAALPATIVDRIGAGDAFSAGLLCGLLEGSLVDGLRYGAAMSAHKLTTFGDMLCATREEILALLEGASGTRPAR